MYIFKHLYKNLIGIVKNYYILNNLYKNIIINIEFAIHPLT